MEYTTFETPPPTKKQNQPTEEEKWKKPQQHPLGSESCSDAAMCAWHYTMYHLTSPLALFRWACYKAFSLCFFFLARAFAIVVLLARGLGIELRRHREHREEAERYRPDWHKMTPLQKHVAFFDRNNDGKVTWYESYKGFRALGWNPFNSAWASAFVNFSMAFATSPYWWPTTTIYMKNVHRSTHGSDTRLYDHHGQFDEARFLRLWAKYDPDDTGYMTPGAVWRMTEDMRDAWDFFGWTAAKFEWTFVIWLLGDRHGCLKKEDMKGLYDGSIFYKIEHERHQQMLSKTRQWQKPSASSSSSVELKPMATHRRGEDEQREEEGAEAGTSADLSTSTKKNK
ncbi:Peroxygenase 4 [Balamuthia mandrillaris]